MILSDDLAAGKGELARDYDMIHKHMATIEGKVKMGARKLKVVVDSGNGLSGSYVPPVMEALGVEVDLPVLRAGRHIPQPSAEPRRPGTDQRSRSGSRQTQG